ncbi:MAG: hypothetical protein Q7R50_02410 [Dehalococcoidales bacterium]|nr:hypothetical protein [Dehalococcoidales bacterium]
MIYRVFDSNSPTQVKIAEIHDPNYPLIKQDETIPLSVSGKESLYKVTKVGSSNWNADNKIVIDIWVMDLFPKEK